LGPTGQALTVMITAQDRLGKTVERYPDTVHFMSSDPNAILPPDSTLTAGSGIFSVTFRNPGAQTLTVTDIDSPSVTGSAAVAVASNITIVNAASLVPGQGAPNTILTAFGTFSGCGASTQATVNGIASTVFYASPTQINVLLPGYVAGQQSASVQFSCAGLTTIPASVPIAAASPALFTVTASGTGQAAVVNQDGSIDSPCPRGSVIAVYGTGFGQLQPPDANGLSSLMLPITATIGGTAAPVVFAGQAPGFTTGLQQINISIPAYSPTGAAALVLSAGGTSTQAAVTLVIQ
jgi:uncharacterized protein (TIGR03437 family)